MITPFIKQEKYNIGDIVINTEPIIYGYCYVHVGHKFTIVRYDTNYDTYILKDNEDDLIIEVRGNNRLSLVTDVKTAQNYYIEANNKKQAIKFICDNCPNKHIIYSGRDEYDGCSIIDKKTVYQPWCEPQLDCIKYISNDKIKKTKNLYVYFRKLKVKRLLN